MADCIVGSGVNVNVLTRVVRERRQHCIRKRFESKS